MDGAMLSRKEKPIHLGQSSQEPNLASTRLLRPGDGKLVFPGSSASGRIHFRLESASEKEPQRARVALGPRFTELGRAGLGLVPGLLSPPPFSSAGGAHTSVGRSLPSADVGSRTRSSSRRRAAPSACCVAFPSSFTPRSRRRESIPAAFSPLPAPPPRSAGQSGVLSRSAARVLLALSPQSPRSPCPGPASGASAPPENLLAPAARASGASCRSGRRGSERASSGGGWGRW